MEQRLVRVVVAHEDHGEGDYHEWVCLDDRVKADKRGRLNPRMMFATWTRWICNSPDCSAWALVSDNAIIGLIEEAPGGRRPS